MVTAQPSTQSTTKPTIVFVHGAFAADLPPEQAAVMAAT